MYPEILTSLVIREMKMKTTRYQFTPNRLARHKNSDNAKC